MGDTRTSRPRVIPEQILPIQLALEGDEFLRRFAERELLYFYREEPRVPTTEEIIVLVDQGVRTWGEVRLALAGAAIAVGRQAERRGIAVKLAVTSDGTTVVDPARLEPRALAELLAASDLSAHPGEALDRLRALPSASRRDIILLTHPRNLLATEVVEAARSLADEAGARLFAISIDARGRLELADLRRGLPVVLARSRIDLVAPAPAPAEPPAALLPDRPIPMVWKGSFESIGFPFQTGVLDSLEATGHSAGASFDFDEAGDRLLIVGRHGLLFTCRLDGWESEILPRPRVDGAVLTLRRAVMGVAGGFIVEGLCERRRFLAHYDFPGRTCTLHEIDEWQGELSWLYYRDLHAVAGLPVDRERAAWAIDLGETGAKAMTTPRAGRAAARANAGIQPHPLTVSRDRMSHDHPDLRPLLQLDSTSGTLRYVHGPNHESVLRPLVDGLPALKGSQVVRALQGGDVLAILVAGESDPVLYFVAVSTGMVLGLFPVPARAFALARDGERFARSLGGGRLEVRDVPGDQPPILVTPIEKVWIHFATLGRSCLLIREFDLSGPRRPQITWLVRWDEGQLSAVPIVGDSTILDSLGGVVAVSRSVPTGNHGLGYDPERFVQVIESRGMRILIDRYNYLVVLGRRGEPVCMMFVSFREFAAWLPDGTVFGDRRLIGGETTSSAGERIAAALKRAEEGGGNSS